MTSRCRTSSGAEATFCLSTYVRTYGSKVIIKPATVQFVSDILYLDKAFSRMATESDCPTRCGV